jgi:hypothetical protein
MAVCDRQDCTAFSAASRQQQRPFFAELKLASMKVSDRSSLPRFRRSSASVQQSRQNAIVLPLLEASMAGGDRQFAVSHL